MEWSEAEERIRTNIKVGTDVNTIGAKYRFIQAVDVPINNPRYGYRKERGFVVPIGRFTTIQIPWSMLRECFSQLCSPHGYSGASFRRRFPRQASEHYCHVHTIGQIFVKAGIARLDGKTYRLL